MKLRDYINRSFLAGTSVLSRRTHAADLDRFFSLMNPLSTNHDLIRIGSEADGGYLIPDDLAGIEALFSPGVDVMSDFESQLATMGIDCFLADYSVEQPPIAHPKFHFEKKFLGLDNDVLFTTLEAWIQRNAAGRGDMLLQMDIEGAEYRVLLDADRATLRKFRILVIEFHELQELWQQRGLDLIESTFHKLLKDFEMVHIHPNNKARIIRRGNVAIPPLLEVTFLRKDRIDSAQRTTTFPHPLDRQNVDNKPDFTLPDCWYRGARLPSTGRAEARPPISKAPISKAAAAQHR
jgi:hypothetical protein